MSADSARVFENAYVESSNSEEVARTAGRPVVASSAPAPSLGARLVDGLRYLLWTYGALVLVGLVALAYRGRVTTTERFANREPNAGPRRLAHFTNGTRVRASSYDGYRLGHPLYVIDGDDSETEDSLWASDPRDRAPWIQVELPERVNLKSVELVFNVEKGAPLRPYNVICLREGRSFDGASSEGAHTSRMRHPLECRGADSLRIEFARSSGPQVLLREITLGGEA